MSRLDKVKDLYWDIPWIPSKYKELFFFKLKAYLKGEQGNRNRNSKEALVVLKKYCEQVLNIPTMQDPVYYQGLEPGRYQREEKDPKLIAYYLTQFHPIPENDEWWGKGATEWTNVSKAVPQYIGHYQPRLPGELGFYDLRLKENIVRQVELAKMYGVYGFAFYYYWFDGKRLLEKPLDMFVNDEDIDFPFCLCWANENWTKCFWGSSREVIMRQSSTVESYKNFIHDIVKYMRNKNYICVNGKKLLQIYRPENIPHCREVIQYWRDYCEKEGIGPIYVVGCWVQEDQKSFLQQGFDAMSEFQITSLQRYCKKINQEINFANENFYGAVYSYKTLVEDKIYQKNFDCQKIYNAILPMCDNTPRRNNMGSIIFDGSTPELYKTWLKDIIRNNQERTDLDDNLIFVNAWNEWGEGAYLEPDRRFGYAYLQATRDAILETRI